MENCNSGELVMFRILPVAVVFLLPLSLIAANTNGGEDDAEYVRWPWPIACSEKMPEEVVSRLDTLREIIGVKLRPQSSHKSNPVCCLWVEVGTWNPNPGRAGYVLIIQPGGGILIATNLKQLDIAITRLKEMRKIEDSEVRLPVGLSTNFQVIEE
jgi:hypothetical protein